MKWHNSTPRFVLFLVLEIPPQIPTYTTKLTLTYIIKIEFQLTRGSSSSPCPPRPQTMSPSMKTHISVDAGPVWYFITTRAMLGSFRKIYILWHKAFAMISCFDFIRLLRIRNVLIRPIVPIEYVYMGTCVCISK